ncbi:MAG TPA: 3-deoxy-7-phosphoheptulonate synthase [Thermoplasmataceae archaeon]|nr:3-deoxy-7-phosphoheptulonate synthase [Thermoplasmataceae archaeon]
MIIIPKSSVYEEALKDNMMDSTFSYRVIDLYGRKIILTEGQTPSSLPMDSDTALLVNGNLYSKEFKQEKTVVQVDNVSIGEKKLIVAAGPCAVESEGQVMETAEAVKKMGADMLRGGAFKPRTSPYSFQGLGPKGIQLLMKAREETGLPVVSELLDISDFSAFRNNVDMIQVGARNAQNFTLLKFLGQLKTPVLLKNGLATTMNEWLGSSEYILSGGNENVVMCYRGNRSFENYTRFNMDIGSIASLKNLTHLPICADPSHPAGRRELVESLALGAVASGADMLEVEVHRDPDNALSDSSQQLTLEMFNRLMKNVRKVEEIVRG